MNLSDYKDEQLYRQVSAVELALTLQYLGITNLALQRLCECILAGDTEHVQAIADNLAKAREQIESLAADVLAGPGEEE